MEKARLHVAKLAALLHDPAWKPWVISQAFGGVGRVLAEVSGSHPAGYTVDACKSLTVNVSQEPFNCWYVEERGRRRLVCDNVEVDAHQLDAAAAVWQVFKDQPGLANAIVNEILRGRTVDEADRLAAAIDRWMLTYKFRELKDVRMDIDKVYYANPLDPRFKVKPKTDLTARTVCEYVESLRKLAESAKGLPLPLLYNILYLALEPLWYRHCRMCVPLADTRTPTHTVFDHVYATAAMVNWVYDRAGGAPRGFLVKIDIAGIQNFISAARRTRDLWAGSWLISLLAWYTVSEAVMLLGGDVVLSPYNAANHFFIATVLKELVLESRKHGGKAGKLAEKLGGIAAEAYLWTGIPSQPIIPGTFFLALPCLDNEAYKELLGYAKELETVDETTAIKLLEALKTCDGDKLREYFVERFIDGWRRLTRAVIGSYVEGYTDKELAEAFADRISSCSFYDKDDIKKYLEEAMRRPPFQLRVTVVDVGEEYQKLQAAVKEKLNNIKGELAERLGADEVAKKLLFMWLFHKAIPDKEKEFKAKSISIEAGYIIGDVVEEITSKPDSNYRECTVCSKLPAVLHVKAEGECGPNSIADRLSAPVGLFMEGELLCPYCLIKRLATTEKAIIAIMDSLNLHSATKDVVPPVPSTCQLAALNELIVTAEKLASNDRLRSSIAGVLEEYSKRRGAGDRLKRENLIATLVDYIKYSEKTKHVADDVIKTLSLLEEMPYEYSCLIAAGKLSSTAECTKTLVEAGMVKDVAEKLCGYLVELAREAGIRPSRYYAIIRGDGDFFGSRIVRGILDFNNAEEYVEAILKAISDEQARRSLEQYYKELARLLVDIMWSITSDASKASRKPVTIVTPTYYMALSRGQMITAIIDASIVTALAGYPIYAGGDDVAALAPGYIKGEHASKLVEIQMKYGPLARLGIGLTPSRASVPGKLDGIGFIPGWIVLATRWNYWGLLSGRPGFHVMPVGAVYPAPVAYGRSYGVYVAHYRDPFTAAWRVAGELEEMKDTLGFTRYSKGCEETSKDITVLAYGRVSGIAGSEYTATALPNMKPVTDKEEVAEGKAELVALPLQHTLKLLGLVDGGVLTRSLYKDFIDECSIAEMTAKQAKAGDRAYAEIAGKLAAEILRRNLGVEHSEPPSWLLEAIEEYSLILPCARSRGARGKEEEREGEVEEELSLLQCVAPLTWLLILSSRVLDAGRR